MEHLSGVTLLKRLRAHPAGSLPPVRGGHALYCPETPSVVEDQDTTGMKAKTYGGMFWFRVPARWRGEGKKATGHSEVHSDDMVSIQSNHHIFRSSVHTLDRATLRARREAALGLTKNVGPHDLCPNDLFADDGRAEASYDGLCFW
jgi:hypothetical protein